MHAAWRQASNGLRQQRRWAAARGSRCTLQQLQKQQPYHQAARLSPLVSKVVNIHEEVADALATDKPVVALESTIYTHGALSVDLRLEAIVRENGGVPAVIGVLDAVPTVGLTPAEIERMVHEGASKVSRRDLASLVGRGPARHGEKPRHGGTTISGTMVLARLAGIRVFGTGGLGGVHRNWADHLDISADLSELGRTRVAVVSSGCKGFLDIAATLEYLETQGVYVATFADGREKVDFPAFWARESGLPSPAVVQDEAEAAAIIWAQERLHIETGLLFANAIPAVAEVPRAEMEAVIDQAVDEAAAGGFTGSRNTPFVLARIRELTDQRSVGANLALVQSNVERAAKVAVHLSALMAEDSRSSFTSYPVARDPTPSPPRVPVPEKKEKESPAPVPVADDANHGPATPGPADILVAGSVALDLSCDYAGEEGKGPAPELYTSNPASIVPTIGGVGHNVALAAHRISPSTKVRLCTMVGQDLAGATVLGAMQANGLDTSGVRQLAAARTAHYIAVNGADKNLMVAMADMAIFAADHHPDADVDAAAAAVTAASPRWLVVDGNWSPAGLHGWIQAGRAHGARVAFEPVSVAKSARLFALPPQSNANDANGLVFPQPLIDLATPNQYELAAMHAAAGKHGYLLDDPRWFRVIDALGMQAGARDRFVRLTSMALTDAGVPQQMVQLLPYMPTLVAKLGSEGALLAKLLARDDPLLYDAAAQRYILVRAPPHAGPDATHNDTEAAVGGVYMRLFPPVEQVHDVISVNGVGDTFLGALVGGLAQGGRVERLVDVAQKAAVVTLRSRESVGAGLPALAGQLTAAAK